MSCDCVPPDGASRTWRTADGQHLDVRGLEPPQPMVEVLGLIDRGEAENVVIVHLDHEPIFLYPELDDRGWSHEIVDATCGDASCEDDVRLRIVRLVA
ncbi:MAG: DUF2249 domain-containing protein [Rhizobiales bacterium]|nr:DUF2249 domain-containing protein [Hyphomicrobiales bacterium]